MGWVRKTDEYGLQAVHKVDGVETTKYFSFSKYKGEANAEKEARKWLEEILEFDPQIAGPRREPQKNKKDSYPAGVYFYHNDKGHQGFQVRWKDKDGWPRTKNFFIGSETTATEKRFKLAEKAALQFREAFVDAFEQGKVFNDRKWRNWRTTVK